jgi:hypothetical protein
MATWRSSSVTGLTDTSASVEPMGDRTSYKDARRNGYFKVRETSWTDDLCTGLTDACTEKLLMVSNGYSDLEGYIYGLSQPFEVF